MKQVFVISLLFYFLCISIYIVHHKVLNPPFLSPFEEDPINYKRGWKYGTGVGLFKREGAFTLSDYIFQGYHFHI